MSKDTAALERMREITKQLFETGVFKAPEVSKQTFALKSDVEKIEEQLTDTQLALCEIFEMMEGM